MLLLDKFGTDLIGYRTQFKNVNHFSCRRIRPAMGTNPPGGLAGNGRRHS